MSIELVMSFSHLILCHPLLLLPSILPSIRVFSNESTLCRRWPKYWNFIFSISPSNEYSVLIPVLPSLMILIIFLWLALLDYLYLSSFLAVALGIDPCLWDSYLEQVTCTLLEFICLKEKRFHVKKKHILCITIYFKMQFCLCELKEKVIINYYDAV